MDLTKQQRINLWVKTKNKSGLTISDFSKKYGIPRTKVVNWHKTGVSKKHIKQMLEAYKEIFGKEFTVNEEKVDSKPSLPIAPSSPAWERDLAHGLKKEDGKVLRNIIAFIKERCEMKVTGQEYFAMSYSFERQLQIAQMLEKYIN